jgi:hypothetical protein
VITDRGSRNGGGKKADIESAEASWPVPTNYVAVSILFVPRQYTLPLGRKEIKLPSSDRMT